MVRVSFGTALTPLDQRLLVCAEEARASCVRAVIVRASQRAKERKNVKTRALSRNAARAGIALSVTTAALAMITLPANASSTHHKPRSAAPAVTCGPSAPDLDGHTATTAHTDSGFSGPAMRAGPGGNCALLTRVPWGDTVSLNCYRSGDHVGDATTWSAVHYRQYFGWISDYYLSGYGSNFAC